MDDCTVEYSEHSLNGVTAHCTIIGPRTTFKSLIVEMYNDNNTAIDVDLRKIRIKYLDWYYYIPYLFWIEPHSIRRFEMFDTALEKVDNLTYIEELAKQKNLI